MSRQRRSAGGMTLARAASQSSRDSLQPRRTMRAERCGATCAAVARLHDSHQIRRVVGRDEPERMHRDRVARAAHPRRQREEVEVGRDHLCLLLRHKRHAKKHW
eukprot:6187369-Pleurochrysis_carterae.AAC.1